MRFPNIEAERARHGWTKEELAEYLGVCNKTLYNWYKSGKIPEKKQVLLAEIFGVDVKKLMKGVKA